MATKQKFAIIWDKNVNGQESHETMSYSPDKEQQKRMLFSYVTTDAIASSFSNLFNKKITPKDLEITEVRDNDILVAVYDDGDNYAEVTAHIEAI